MPSKAGPLALRGIGPGTGLASSQEMRIPQILLAITLFGLLPPATAWSQDSCQLFFDTAPAGPADATINASMLSQMTAFAVTYDPFLVSDGSYLLPLEGRAVVDTFQLTGAAKSQLVGYQNAAGDRFLIPSMNQHTFALSQLYAEYYRASRLDKKTIEEVVEVERQLPTSRISSVVIYGDANQTNLFGFFRIFDGTDYPRRGNVAHEKFYSDYRLPLEKIARLNGRKVEAVNLDRKNKLAVFELGKALIAKGLTSAERNQARRLLAKWIIDKIITDSEEDDHIVYYADVGTEVHRKLYEKEYGLIIVDDPALNGGLKPPEYLMRVDQRTLRAHLSQYFKQNGQ